MLKIRITDQEIQNFFWNVVRRHDCYVGYLAVDLDEEFRYTEVTLFKSSPGGMDGLIKALKLIKVNGHFYYGNGAIPGSMNIGISYVKAID